MLEDRSKPQGRKLSIAVTVLPANTLSPRPDPLFMLAGGPGQSSDAIAPLAEQLSGVRRTRDIVLIDPRGAGRSSPLSCAALKPRDPFDELLDADTIAQAAQRCIKEIQERGDTDVAQYATSAYVADIDEVRAALGYERINLWGGSYGTRVAQEYVRRYPARVRSVVLDGVAPPDMKISLDVWPSRDAAIAGIIGACAEDPPCRQAYPDLNATLARIRARLEPAQRVSVDDPRTGAPHKVALPFDVVIGALHGLVYAPELASLIPPLLGRAEAGDFAPLVAAAMMLTGDLNRTMNLALHYAVTCAEDVPRLTPSDVQSIAKLRAPVLAERNLDACVGWPRPPVPADFFDPLTSDTPVLILSGGARSGDAAGQWRAGRQDTVPQPARRRRRIRAHRVAARVRAASDREVHRRRGLRDAAAVVPRLPRDEQAAAAFRVAARTSMIVVDGLAKSFGKRREIKAVDGASFRAADGAITGLLGPNGAGKTTLLRMLATLIAPDAGSATVDGLDIVRDRFDVRRSIGVLSDARGLYGRLTARENVRYYGRLHGLGGAALDARIDTLLAQLGLTDLADRRAQGFSQGERMKVAIARALVHDPATILLDEPTNGLDIMSIRGLRELLRSFAHRASAFFSRAT